MSNPRRAVKLCAILCCFQIYFGESLIEHRSTQTYNLTMLIVFYNLNFELNERSHGL